MPKGKETFSCASLLAVSETVCWVPGPGHLHIGLHVQPWVQWAE